MLFVIRILVVFFMPLTLYYALADPDLTGRIGSLSFVVLLHDCIYFRSYSLGCSFSFSRLKLFP
jgi:hypothetical protein